MNRIPEDDGKFGFKWNRVYNVNYVKYLDDHDGYSPTDYLSYNPTANETALINIKEMMDMKPGFIKKIDGDYREWFVDCDTYTGALRIFNSLKDGNGN